MLVAGCGDDSKLKDLQRAAIQNKLEQMGRSGADVYIRNQMGGVYMPNSLGLYLDDWAKHDINGTFVDEYVDYVMGVAYKYEEKEIKNQVAEKYRVDNARLGAENNKAKLQRRIDRLQKIGHRQKQIDKLQKKIDKIDYSTYRPSSFADTTENQINQIDELAK